MVREPGRDEDPNTTNMGLGLSIAREVVTAHGGSIDVTSTAQDGTEFTVKLPRHLPKARSQAD